MAASLHVLFTLVCAFMFLPTLLMTFRSAEEGSAVTSTSALLPHASITACKASLPGTSLRSPCLFIHVDSLKVTPWNVKAELPHITEAPCVEATSATRNIVGVGEPTKEVGSSGGSVGVKLCLAAVGGEPSG